MPVHAWRRVSTSTRIVAVVLIALTGVAIVAVSSLRSDEFSIGEQERVTATINCWRAFVRVDGTEWLSPSTDVVPQAWADVPHGLGSVDGTIVRLSDDAAEFRHDGVVVALKRYPDNVDGECPDSGAT